MIAEHPPALSSAAGGNDAGMARSLERGMLRWLAGRLASGELVIDTPSGGRLTLQGRVAGPRLRLSIHDWRLLYRLAAGWDLGLAEGYIAGEWSSPDLKALLTWAAEDGVITDPLRRLRAFRLVPRIRHALNRNTRSGSRRNIAAHYDLGNAFYRRWLDDGMSYSAGLFSSPHLTLESAQEAKLDRVCELLELSGGERVLEIGCGWGALAERLMKTSAGSLVGVTLSREQLAYAQSRLSADIQTERCELRLQDYRDVDGQFDRIVSIEMLEAVGEAYWPTYFAKLRDRLRPGGVAVLQVITIDEPWFEDYRRRPDFIQRYIFPGGMLPTKRIIANQAGAAGLRPVLTASFGPGYARTTEEWRRRFELAWPEIEPLGFDQRFKRMWEYYLAYCQAGFETGAIDVSFFKFVRADS
jgi:cyclopropane-fatty-acyl-phospholipid synthase